MLSMGVLSQSQESRAHAFHIFRDLSRTSETVTALQVGKSSVAEDKTLKTQAATLQWSCIRLGLATAPRVVLRPLPTGELSRAASEASHTMIEAFSIHCSFTKALTFSCVAFCESHKNTNIGCGVSTCLRMFHVVGHFFWLSNGLKLRN